MLKALVLAITLILPTNALASFDLFLKIDGVLGESISDRHVNEIDVVSFAWGVGPNDARKPVTCPTELTINKLIDAASTPLALAALTKQRFAEARLLVRKPGDSGRDFLIVTMRNVGVARYQTGGEKAADTIMESVELTFTEVTVSYIPTTGPGRDGTPISFTYQATKPCAK